MDDINHAVPIHVVTGDGTGPVQPDFKTDRDGMSAMYTEYYRQVKDRTVR